MVTDVPTRPSLRGFSGRRVKSARKPFDVRQGGNLECTLVWESMTEV